MPEKKRRRTSTYYKRITKANNLDIKSCDSTSSDSEGETTVCDFSHTSHVPQAQLHYSTLVGECSGNRLVDNNTNSESDDTDINIGGDEGEDDVSLGSNETDTDGNIIIDNVDQNAVIDENINIKLARWAVSTNIPQCALNKLLSILKPYHPSLPVDSRTLLQTPRQIIVKAVDPGKYYHFGLENSVQRLVSQSCKEFENIEIAVNIDGLPIAKSSNSELYPILVSLFPCTMGSNVATAGIYHGYGKPKDANTFLTDFVNEANHLITDGIDINGKKVPFLIKVFICDAPAKSFIKYTKGHTGYYSCSKCNQEGEFANTIYFSDMNFTPRTDQDFLEQKQEEHHTGTSLLSRISNFGMISGFPLDYMHLICLGVMKKLLTLWCFGKPPGRLNSIQIKTISQKLCSQKENIPGEFARKPRSLDEIKRWKATEFRQFLFYTGSVVLKGILNKKMYQNFLCLHIGCSILSLPNVSGELLEYADSVLKYFVKTFGLLYGNGLISHNVHNVLHLTEDVRTFGPLDNFSAFKFENYMKSVKKVLRKPNLPLSQIVKRFTEIDNLTKMAPNKKRIGLEKEHNSGPLPADYFGTQYSLYREEAVLFTSKHPNNVCGLKNGLIVIIRNFASNSKGSVIVGQKCNIISNYYDKPCNSSTLGIFRGTDLSIDLEIWPLSEIKIKYVPLKLFGDEYVFIPMLHH